jgi:hypothetical protein
MTRPLLEIISWSLEYLGHLLVSADWREVRVCCIQVARTSSGRPAAGVPQRNVPLSEEKSARYVVSPLLSPVNQSMGRVKYCCEPRNRSTYVLVPAVSTVKSSLYITNYTLCRQDVWGSGCIHPNIFYDFVISWRSVVSFTLWPLYPGENIRGCYWIWGWMGLRDGLDAV